MGELRKKKWDGDVVMTQRNLIRFWRKTSKRIPTFLEGFSSGGLPNESELTQNRFRFSNSQIPGFPPLFSHRNSCLISHFPLLSPLFVRFIYLSPSLSSSIHSLFISQILSDFQKNSQWLRDASFEFYFIATLTSNHPIKWLSSWSPAYQWSHVGICSRGKTDFG